MARHSRTYEPPVEDEPDAAPHSSEDEAGAEAAGVTPLTPGQDNTHATNVAAAAATKQVSVATATTTFQASAMAAADKATWRTAVRNADIAFHRSIISSALANAQPAPVGSLQVLQNFGVTQ
jgi:hypothetical protein